MRPESSLIPVTLQASLLGGGKATVLAPLVCQFDLFGRPKRNARQANSSRPDSSHRSKVMPRLYEAHAGSANGDAHA